MQCKSILLIEDDPEDEEFFIDAIRTIDPSIHCTVLRDSREALEKLIGGETNPDIIFIDFYLLLMRLETF